MSINHKHKDTYTFEGDICCTSNALKVFFCRQNTPTGVDPWPYSGECAGGLSGLPCASCPEGQSWGGEQCEDCGATAVVYALGIPVP